MNLYVGNLPFTTDEGALEELFRAHGEVKSAKIISDRETGRSRGFGFVEMPNKNEALAAIDALADTDFNGRNLVVNEARPKANRY